MYQRGAPDVRGHSSAPSSDSPAVTAPLLIRISALAPLNRSPTVLRDRRNFLQRYERGKDLNELTVGAPLVAIEQLDGSQLTSRSNSTGLEMDDEVVLLEAL